MQNPVDTGMHVQMAPYAQPACKSSRMKSIFTTGILQIIGGTILILCGFVLVCVRYYIPYRNNFDNSICGIWGGSVSYMSCTNCLAPELHQYLAE